MGRLRVGVIFGGRSGEHEVSLMSAASIIQALDPARYEVVQIGITPEGRWVTAPDALAALTARRADQAIPASLLPDPARRALVELAPQAGSGLPLATREIDVFVPVLHGPYGEDGTIQGLLELADVPYVGAGVAASAVGMDKALMKALFRQAGLPMVDYVVVRDCDWERDPAAIGERVEQELGFPCFAKPANLGSSVGISKVRGPEELPAAIALAARYDRKVIVEAAARECREVECSVLGNDDPIASVTGEIVPCNEFYDYEAKYLDDRSELIIPARIAPQTQEKVRAMAVQAFQAIDCAGLARVDFFVHKETERIYVNEINTMPGFTRISMYPKLWEASGVPFGELVDRLIELALDRHRKKGRLQRAR